MEKESAKGGKEGRAREGETKRKGRERGRGEGKRERGAREGGREGREGGRGSSFSVMNRQTRDKDLLSTSFFHKFGLNSQGQGCLPNLL